jgi:glycerol-3-phosphate acyltransferase PlsY
MRWGLIAAAYLIGSIPFGVIIARFHNVNLREQGSGNIGATNALRVMGKKAAIITLLGDTFKGTAAVYLAMRFGGYETALLAAAAAVIGHDFTVFTGFKGGKGVATSFGVLLALEPFIALAAIVVWIATVAIFRISSLGALVSFAAVPFIVLLNKQSGRPLLILTVFLTCLIFFKHMENIIRLLKGEESRIGQKSRQ